MNNDLAEKVTDKKIPKDIQKTILKKIIKNIVIAMVIVLYIFILKYARTKIAENRLIEDIKIFAGTFLIVGIVFFEQAYKRDSGYKTVYGIEMVLLSAHTLSIMYVMTRLNFDFQTYMLISMAVVIIYYLIKSIFIFTIEKKKYIDRFNDISEIVKDEPQKREAKKRMIGKETKAKGKRLTGTRVRPRKKTD